MRAEEKEGPALQAAIAHGFERASVQKAHAILADALNCALGSVDLKRLKARVDRSRRAARNFWPTRPTTQLMAEYTTKEGIQAEEWAVNSSTRLAGKFAPLADKATIENSHLSDEQKEAVEFVCRSRNQVCGCPWRLPVQARQRMLKALDQQLTAAGDEMLYLAPTAAAAKVLQREGFLTRRPPLPTI